MPLRELTIKIGQNDINTNDERFQLDGIRIGIFGRDDIRCDYQLAMTIIINESPYTITIEPKGIASETLTSFMHDLLNRYTLTIGEVINTDREGGFRSSKNLIFRLKYARYT
jgi:hypothetical protein